MCGLLILAAFFLIVAKVFGWFVAIITLAVILILGGLSEM